MTVRVIPRLDIKGPDMVKGIHLEGLRVLGQPERFAQYYYEQGADGVYVFNFHGSREAGRELLTQMGSAVPG